MKASSWSVASLVAMLLLFTSAVNADEWGPGGSDSNDPISRPLASAFCAEYNISGQVSGPGDTNGNFGDMEEGDTFTFIATGNGTGTWRIVADPDGSQTFASGGAFPGTLTYVVPAGGLTGLGLGFYVDSYTGPGDTISGTCGDAESAPVPSLSFWSRILVVFIIGLIGFAAFQRKRQREIS